MPRMQPKVREFLTKLREDAFLEIRAGYVDSGAAPGKDTAWKDPAQLKPQTTTKEEVAARKHKKKLLSHVLVLREQSRHVRFRTNYVRCCFRATGLLPTNQWGTFV